MSEHQEPLSSQGKERRVAMLPELQAEMTKLHRNRRRRRSTAALAIGVVALGAILIPILSQSRSLQQPILAKNDAPSKIDIAPATVTTAPESVDRGGVRMVAISTDDVLQAFADVRVAAGVRCDASGLRCEVFFPGRESSAGLIIQ
jgi:hypothetical protein